MKMKKAMCLVAALLLLAGSMAYAASDSGRFPQEAAVGDCVFRITGFSFRDRIGCYNAGSADVDGAGAYYKPDDGATFAVLCADIVNKSGAAVNYLEGCGVKVAEGEAAVYKGWAAQQNHDNLARFGDVFGEDSGKQNLRWAINREDAFAIQDGETGHYLFVCSLPNPVVNGTEALNMVITLAGEKKITYQIREKQSAEAFFSSASDAQAPAAENVPAPVAAPTAAPPAVAQSVPLASMAKGAKGNDVVTLQRTLIELGYLTGSADGDFGGKTEAAVQAAQGMAGMPATGVADNVFLTELFSGRIPNALGNLTQLSPRVISMGETSHHSEKHGTYTVSNVFDGNTATCWAEGASGYGIGEGITFTVATFGRSAITLNIYSGYHKSSKRYYQNGRPEDITLRVDGIPHSHTFADVMSPEAITIDGLEGRAFVTFGITIESAYSGSEWKDTCISEIEIY